MLSAESKDKQRIIKEEENMNMNTCTHVSQLWWLCMVCTHYSYGDAISSLRSLICAYILILKTFTYFKNRAPSSSIIGINVKHTNNFINPPERYGKHIVNKLNYLILNSCKLLASEWTNAF